MVATTTSDRSYFSALRPRIKFKSLDGSDTYFTFNGFGSPQDINVMYCDVGNGIGETGDFNIIVEDSANTINKDHLRNTRVYIELGKTQASLKHFLIGFADIFDIERPNTAFQQYRISGFGTQIQASELLLLIRQASKIQIADQKVASKLDPEFSVKRLYARCMTENKFRPLNREDIGSITGWKTDIANDLNTNYPIINEVFTTVADFFDRLASLEGCDWFIDYSTGNEVLTVRHPTKSYTNIIIKSGDLKLASDNANRISYIKREGFNVTDDSSTSAGIRTRLYTTTIIDQETIASNYVNKGSTTLNERFIAQQVQIANDQRRITDLAFIIRKIGDPESPKSRINGLLVIDDGDKPIGKQISKFSIPLSSLKDKEDTIFVNDIDVKSRFIEGGDKVWLILQDRSGIKGNVEDDPANTVAWHHDGSFTAHTSGSLSAQVSITADAQRDDYSALNWTVSTNGPQYTFGIFSNIKRLLTRTNPSAAKVVRMKEGFIDSSFLKSPISVSRFLSLNLAQTSKARRTLSDFRVTIPNNYLFRPYQWVTFVDGLSDVEQTLQVSRVRYTISALPGDPQLGCYEANIALNGSFNPLVGSCRCS